MTGQGTAVHVEVIIVDLVDHPAMTFSTHFRVRRRVTVVHRTITHHDRIGIKPSGEFNAAGAWKDATPVLPSCLAFTMVHILVHDSIEWIFTGRIALIDGVADKTSNAISWEYICE